MQKIIFQILSLFFLGIALLTVVLTDWINQIPIIAIFFLMSALFLTASINLKKALITTLLILPVFFFLDNLQEVGSTFKLSLLSEYGFIMGGAKFTGFITAIVFSACFIWKEKDRLKDSPMKILIPFSIFLICINSLWSSYLAESINLTVFFFLLGLTFFISYLLTKDSSDFMQGILILLAYSSLTIIMSYYQLLFGFMYQREDSFAERLSGPFAQPNPFGNFLFLMISIAIVLFIAIKWNKKTKKYRNFILIYLISSVPILILTYSRSSWIALFLFLILFSIQNRKLFFRIILTLFLCLMILLSIETTQQRIVGIFQRSMFDSWHARQQIWSLSWEKFQQKPVTGYGIGTFQETLRDAKESGSGTDRAHNDIVFFAVEGGMIGLTGFLLFTFGFYFYGILFLFKNKKLENKNFKLFDKNCSFNPQILNFGIISILISISLIGTIESHYNGNILHLFVWFILGSWFSLNKLQFPSKKLV